ncbi:MAG: YceI family protein [candidate division WOR-3 bacterium]
MRITKQLLASISITSVFALPVSAETYYYEIDRDGSYIKYTAHATTHDMEGNVREFWGWLKVDPETRNIQGKIEVKAKSMTSGNSMRDNNTYKLLEVDKYPMISFEITGLHSDELDKITSKDEAIGKTVSAHLIGSFTLHGVTKEIGIPAQVEIGSSALKGTASFKILLTDYGMEPPEFAMFKAENDVDVKARIVFRQKEEK